MCPIVTELCSSADTTRETGDCAVNPPPTFHFTGSITFTGSGSWTFQWQWVHDGSQAASGTVSFNGPGTKAFPDIPDDVFPFSGPDNTQHTEVLEIPAQAGVSSPATSNTAIFACVVG